MDMDKKPPFDLSLVIPIVIGFFSVFGICLVLLLGRITASRAEVSAPETSTPFQYLFLGTEPAVSTSEPDSEGTETATKTPIKLSSPVFTVDTSTDESGATISPDATTSPSSLITSTPTPTSASTSPLNPATYDEGDTRIVYTGDWIAQSGVSGAYLTTLHVSNTLGNTITFRFIGQQVRLFYQSGLSLGTIRIVIDGLQIDLDQSDPDTVTIEWASALLINGTHTVVITHLSGGSINLDSVVVPNVLVTATPTPP